MFLPPQNEKIFRGQFVLGAPDRPTPEGARRIALRTLKLDVFPGVAVSEVRDAAGALIGVLIGVPVDLDARAVIENGGTYAIAEPLSGNLDAFIERHIYRLAGSFIFVLDVEERRAAYLDANGSLSLVYAPEKGIAAATTGLLLDDEEYVERFQEDLYVAFDLAHDGWFTGGMTAHRGVRRLLCNHYLDFDTAEAVRHWPTEPVAERTPDDAIAIINGEVLATTQALLKSGPVAVALTAGNETRALLAIYRDIRSELTFVTLDAPGYDLDLQRAKELAARYGLKHLILSPKRATPAGVVSWQYRVGHNITGNNMTGHPTIAPLAPYYFVGGLGGEVGRGFLWLNADEDTVIDAGNIIDRLKLPRHPVIMQEVETWLATAPKYSSLFLLDLAYIELRMSCWAFAQSYASADVVKIYPLISRNVYDAMLSLPPESRRANGMIRLSIDAAWPDVLDLPINRYGDYRDQLQPLMRAIRRPHKAWKKVRQLVKANQ